MAGGGREDANNSVACQQRCAAAIGCQHFSYWPQQSNCHIQDGNAVAKFNNAAYSGAPDCSEVCYESGFAWSPDNFGDHDRSETNTPDECQARCLTTAGCKHFTWWLNHGCHLHDQDATRVPNHKVLAGPKTCVAPPTPAPITPPPTPPPIPPAPPPTPAPVPQPMPAPTPVGLTPTPGGGFNNGIGATPWQPGGPSMESMPASTQTAGMLGRVSGFRDLMGSWSFFPSGTTSVGTVGAGSIIASALTFFLFTVSGRCSQGSMSSDRASAQFLRAVE